MDKLRINLNTALFNAGLVGFIKILNRGDISYEINFDELIIDAADLKSDLAQLYIDETIEKYKESTKIYDTINTIENLLISNAPNDQEELNNFFSKCSKISTNLTQASIKTGLTTLNKIGFKNSIYENAEKLKKEKNYESCIFLLKDIHTECLNPKVLETLYMKNIMYTKINMLWENKAFLNRNSSKEDVKKSFEQVFVTPLIEMLESNKTTNKSCSNCDVLCNNLSSFSFLKDIGIDIGKKKSPFWNQKPDLLICPLCSFIYVCTPLGFNQLGQDLVFVNQNDSIDSLISANAKLSFEEREGNINYQFITNLILKEIDIKKKEINNIEVLIRHGGKKQFYSLNIIDKNLIKTILNCKKELNFIKNSKAKIMDNFISISEETLNCLFSRKSLWSLIFTLLINDANPFTIRQLLYIQIKRKEGKLMDYKIARAIKLWNAGNSLAKDFKGDNNNENKLRGIVVKLQNALRVENKDLFFDLLIRLYSSINKSIPDSFLQAMSNSEDFKEIGTAFLLGILGDKADNNQKENVETA